MTPSQQAPSLVERLNLTSLKEWYVRGPNGGFCKDDAPFEAAARITELQARAERAEAQCRVLEAALMKIKRKATAYEHEATRLLDIRDLAIEALSLSGGGGREEADRLISEGHERFVEKHGFRPESPSADAGPYPRSHDEQHSDGGRG